MDYESITLKEELHIRKLYSIHYFEYMKDFVFNGEVHNFWELVCVDSGSIIVTAGDRELTLTANQMIFHKPNEFHALRADGVTSPNLIVISFDCTSDCMDFFENRLVSINQTERFYLGQLLSEAKRSFHTPLNNPYNCFLERVPHAEFGSEQIIFLSLEMLLISLLRRYRAPQFPPMTPNTFPHPLLHRDSDELLGQIIQYLRRHIYEHMTVAQICKDNSVGRSQLQKLFHEKLHCGVIDYFCRLKIEYAQRLIREQRYNYTQIADILGYSSYQYFSLQFKKFTRMTPSEYSSSVKSFSQAEPSQRDPAEDGDASHPNQR